MRILVVEDKASFGEALRKALLAAVPGAEIELRGSAGTAIDALRTETFDFILCDLQLPPIDGSSDLQIAHGRGVVSAALVEASGTPVLVLSAFADKFENLRDLVANAGREDVHGNGNLYPMIDAEVKDRVDEAIETVRQYAVELAELQDIDVDPMDGTTLDLWETRVLRIFGRRSKGRVVHIRRLGGGLSESTTYRVEVVDDHHDRRASVVAKLGTIASVRDEQQRLQREIAPRLTEGTYAPYADAVTGGYGRYGGLFCKLLEGFDTPLGELMRSGDARAVAAIQNLQGVGKPWLAEAPWETMKIGVIRRAQVADEVLVPHRSALAAMKSSQFEERNVNVHVGTQHGDMHGFNVLMRGDSAQLVDYARVGSSFGGTDAVSLELSLAFHPGMRVGSWPTPINASAWADPVAFADGGPYEEIISTCRDWARTDAGSNRALCAVAYAWALRQLRFPGIDAEIALRIAAAAIESFGA